MLGQFAPRTSPILHRIGPLLAALLISACTVAPIQPTVGTVPTSTSESSPPSSSLPGTPQPTPSPTQYADRIRIGLVSPWRGDYTDFGPAPYHLSNLTPIFYPSDAEQVTHFLFRALYRLDTVLTPVPDLAAAPCDASSDGLMVTCTLIPATFGDGTKLSADDIKFTFDLARSEPCPFGNEIGCPGDLINAVDVVDPTTIRFSLSRLDPTFITTILPGVFIDSKAVVEAQFQALHASSLAVGAVKLREQGDSLQTSIEPNDENECAARQGDATNLAAAAGIEPPDKRLFRPGPDGTLDGQDQNSVTSPACAWLMAVRDSLYTAADSLEFTGTDAEAIAYAILPMQWHPVGAGLWRLDEANSVPGNHLVLLASPTADPQPATKRIDFITYTTRDDATKALGAGDIDWLFSPWDEKPARVRNLESTPNIRMVRYAHPASWTEIDFNVRSGQLFSDLNLRNALSLCIDRSATVEAATDGTGAPAAGLFGPDFWAANPSLTVPTRDVATAKSLIEASGWQLVDGTYMKDGRALAADIWVREEFIVRVKLAELVATEARDCGMDLTVKTGTGDQLLRGLPGDHPISRWPNHPPGSDQPFDMFLIGSVGGHDPDPAQQLECFKSEFIDTKENKDGCNYLGYANPQVDDLLDRASATVDVPQRADLYRQALAILAHDLPQLPLFYPLNRVALRNGVTSLKGPLQLDKPGWNWQLESLVLEMTGQ
jgi:ABC-type transport system substrate-binding protein